MEQVNHNVCVDKNYNDFGKIQIFSTFFNDDFLHFNDNPQGLAIRKVSQSNTLTLGMVVYGDKSLYKPTKDENLVTHLPGVCSKEGRDFFIRVFLLFFLDCYGLDPKQIIFGHEHGDDNGKCHLQICVNFEQPFRGTVKPGFFVFSFSDGKVPPLGFDFSISGFRYLFMAQKARNNYALARYCMKDGDFFYSNPELAVKYVRKKNSKGEDTEKIDAFATIVQNRSLLNMDQAKDLAMTHEPRTALTMYKNLEYAFQNEMAKSLPPFTWQYPEHLKGRYSLIENWFTKWCLPEGLMRRKALLLYSKKRCLGKTEFALSLVNDPSYVVIFRNSFVDSTKNKDPKLLILDDMSPYTQQNKETWKALVASQPTAIRDAYLNLNWEFRIPCIITTNNLFLVQQLYRSSDFNTQIIFQEIDEYMGPPGTEPEDMFQVESSFAEETKDQIEKMMRVSEEKLLNRKTERDEISEVMKLKDKINQLENELLKYKK